MDDQYTTCGLTACRICTHLKTTAFNILQARIRYKKISRLLDSVKAKKNIAEGRNQLYDQAC
jgi:hypothetical protein